VKYLLAVVAAGAAGCASAAAPHSPSRPAPTPAGSGVVAVDPAIAAPSFTSGASAAAIASIPTAPVGAALPQDAQPMTGEEVKVTAPRESTSPLREERLIGTNEQPEWTTERRWAKTRAYVLAPGQIEFEQWYKLQMPRGSAPDHFFQTEIGFGLEGGWQVDLYENWGKNPGEATKHEGVQFEVRKALAKWGEMWANPTLYAEYIANEDAADKVEFKLLLADELSTGWHWGTNFVYEQETSGARETELAWSGALSYTIQDSKFSAGVEFNLEHVTGEGFQSHDDAVNEFLLGPSFQWRPTENSHLDFVPLFGLTSSDREDPRYEFWLIFGWDFGPDRDPGRYAGPASTRSR
jgi:hypothetical protein